MASGGQTVDAYAHIKGFMTPHDLRRLNELVHGNSGLLTETSGRAGLGPRYRVIDGLTIRKHLPEVEQYGEFRVRPVVEGLVGEPLRLMSSPRRSMRVQVYDRRSHGFRWHVDGHSYAALLTLTNTNRGSTHIVAPGLSRVLRFLLYPCYAVPQVFSLCPYREIRTEAGDLLLLPGGRVLHRGVTLDEHGERTLLVYGYDEADKRRSRIRDWIATRLNY